MASIFKQKYTAVGTNGKRIRKQSRFWYVDYKTADGTRKRVKGFKDKSATQQLASQLERDAELARVGLIDKFADHRRRRLADHLADYTKSVWPVKVSRAITAKLPTIASKPFLIAASSFL